MGPPAVEFGVGVRAGSRRDQVGRQGRQGTADGVEEGEAFIRLTYAEALDALGNQADARDAIATARVRILERTAMIQDAQWKDTFIEKVRENARTLELARTWRVA